MTEFAFSPDALPPDAASPDAAPPRAAPIDAAVEAALQASQDARAESLLEFARIPSISSLPEHAASMVTAAEWVADRLRGVGATDVEVAPTALHPIVYARIHEAPGAPVVLVYCHYDVQPVDPIELWETAPFDPFLRDGRFVGRGVADDKGQLVMHLSALEALRTAGRAPAVNLTFVFEGEEEYGSDSLYAWIEANRDRLAADVAVISDPGYFEGNVPAITVGLRGIMYAQIDVELSPV
ncbi:MAG: M20/M25/M40 family metallo-hydrolase, partial [Chloroflexi bacterium]|nr:M20/M25/M40 family metallo-hydrolase [Chloroflexota bacterium]